MEINKRKGCERQVYHKIIYKDYERKECIHEAKETFKEQYPTVNTNV